MKRNLLNPLFSKPTNYKLFAMKRVVQRQIDHHYLPITAETLSVGSTIDFDCYIKRFNGYVIIIEAGTTITEDLAAKLARQSQVYISRAHHERYAAYCRNHDCETGIVKEKREEPSYEQLSVDELEEKLKAEKDNDRKIELLYGCGYALMQTCQSVPEEALPVNDLKRYSRLLCQLIRSQKFHLKQFLGKMPGIYNEANHALNVAILGTILAGISGFTDLEIEEIALAGLLHDIGKRRVDPAILNKDAKLDKNEFVKVQSHPTYSSEIIKKNRIQSRQIFSAVRYHHEKLDGSGYPSGLVGNQIPLMAQVLGICDVFDALTTDRTFRPAYSSFDALMLMKKEMAKQINTDYVDRLVKLLKK